MSADTTEQNAANGDGLRERYLPVSRKELRRRREAELAAQRREQGEAHEAEDALAEPDAAPSPDAASSTASSAPSAHSGEDTSEDELSRAVTATFASESDELPEQPAAEEAHESEAATDDVADPDEVADERDGESGDTAALPEPEDEPARPEEEIADAEADSEQVMAEDEVTQVISRVRDLPEDDDAVSHIELPAPGPQPDKPEPEPDGTDEAPAAADAEAENLSESRRIRRMLRETQTIPPLSPELLAELDATNAQIARVEDPTRVDPELLKRQQSLAAKAMQANQERMRQQHAKAEKERRRRGRERPESQVLTDKMVRDSLEKDPEDMQYATGQIEPVHARGAHGLDLNKMIDVTSRQADRQKMLMWVVIVLTILLLAAIAAVVYSVFL